MRLTHENPPNLTAIAYRLGVHATVLRRMLERLHTQGAPAAGGGEPARPLAALTTRAADDPAIALLDAWAVVADVLTFYQERIANEGYLRTAVERRSVVELTRAVGYELRPGLAAGATLAFTVETAPGMDDVIRIPAGVGVQSIPGQDQRPATFETVEAVAARPEWNALRPYAPLVREAPALTGASSGMVLAGASSVPPGAPLLVTGGGRAFVVRAQAVAVEPAAGVTRISWGGPLAADSEPLTSPAVYVARQRAGLFGRGAPPVTRRAGGVFRRPAGDAWARAHAGLPDQEVQALAATRRAVGAPPLLLAAFAGAGIFRSRDQGATWEAAGVGLVSQQIYALCAAGGALYAGAADGLVFRSLDEGDTWVQWASGALLQRTVTSSGADTTTTVALADFGLPRSPVRALHVFGDDVYAATDEGVYRHDARSARWSPVGVLPGARGLTTLPSPERLAATDTSGALYTLDGGGWKKASTPWPAGVAAPALARSESSDDVYAATGAGVFRRLSDDVWVAVDPSGLPGPAARAIAVDPAGALVAAAPLGPTVAEPWPAGATPPRDDVVDLDAVYTGVTPGSLAVLTSGERSLVARVVAVASGRRSTGDRTAEVTRLTLDMDEGQSLLPFYGPALAETEVLAALDPLPLHAPARPLDAPVGGSVIAVEGRFPPLPPGRRLLVAGRLEGGGPGGEVVFVEGVDDAGGHTSIRLRAPGLLRRYARAGLTVYANVAQATHGATVADEVLGSGDGTRANQRFTLTSAPLTYVPSTDEGGAASALRVRVNGVEWSEARSLYELDERSQAYVVRRDADGRVSVIFGDGERGARLPSGVENVVATYRVGSGAEGAVNAESLALLLSRPLGVRAVVNPLPASGGAEPEETEDARAGAPLALLAFDRIVARDDFEHVARSFAGVAKAQAELLWTGRGHLLHLTVAGAGGGAIPPGSPLYEALVAAIDLRRNRFQPVRVDSFERVAFHAAATVFVQARHERAAVERAVREALRAEFSFAARNFGQDVSSSEVIAAAQRVPGVVAVSLTGLGAAGRAAEDGLLAARRARWAGDAPQPAELLVLGDLTLTMEAAG